MINFNEPPYMEKSIDYIRKAVENKKNMWGWRIH